MPARATVLTHVGAVRAGNEDTIAVGGWVRSEPMNTPERLTLDEVPALCLVCDGMGGHAAGEVASRAVVEHLVARRPELGGPEAIARAVEDANAELFVLMGEQPARRGMGTTVAGLVITAARAIVFNVGDSRVYGIGQGRLEQLSTDDTPGPKRADGRTAAMTSSLITQVLGGSEHLPLDVHVLDEPADAREAWLIASDGLTDLVPPDAIAAALADDDEASVRRLFEAAMDAGGDDNVSIVLVRQADRRAPDHESLGARNN
ncbi:MAG TPA: protein phosphatase 2C domain-containing protein [Geminicoccaceae bacterium]